MKKLLLLLIILVVCSTLSTYTFADPVISGVSTPSHGNAITITGTGFGAKSTAAPVHFSDFESYVENSLVSSDGYWSIASDESSTYQPRVTEESAYVGKSCKVFLNQGDIAGSTYQHDMFYRDNLPFSDKIYVDFKLWFYDGTAVGNAGNEGDNYQIKTWRLACALEVPDEYPSIANFNYQEVDSTDRNSYYQLTRQNTTTLTDYQTTYTQSSWTGVQAIVYPGTTGNADGSIYVYKNGVLVVSQTNVNILSGTRNFDLVRFGEYVGNYSSISEAPITRFDNIYIDNDVARVEIGDNATYANATHREIQIPTDWQSDGTSITVTFNSGTFAAGSEVWVFVTDTNGVTSAGYSVTIGSEVGQTVTPFTGSLTGILK